MGLYLMHLVSGPLLAKSEVLCLLVPLSGWMCNSVGFLVLLRPLPGWLGSSSPFWSFLVSKLVLFCSERGVTFMGTCSNGLVSCISNHMNTFELWYIRRSLLQRRGLQRRGSWTSLSLDVALCLPQCLLFASAFALQCAIAVLTSFLQVSQLEEVLLPWVCNGEMVGKVLGKSRYGDACSVG